MYETVFKTICKFGKYFILLSTVFQKKHIQFKCRRLVNDENWSRNLYLVKVLAPFFCWGVEFFFTLQGFIKIYFWINLSYQWQKYAIREIFPASGNLGSWITVCWGATWPSIFLTQIGCQFSIAKMCKESCFISILVQSPGYFS